ncbi:hypothetical protein RNJ44_01538 [Nakaseomyces bracarensis]|uniref:Arrestin C-terminal-like domain-containing protein n=1 Tax=Nakaseomyces bracarensis TaxID=273131 RepID=A0ABR4NQ01_9SACH
MLSSKNSSSKDPLLFDIRLNNVEDDIILLKGNAEEASSVFLSGTVVFSVQQPVHIKNMSLRLNGKIYMNVPMKNQPKGQVIKYNKVQRRFYLHQWDNFNIKNYFANLYDNYGKTTISSESGFTPEERKISENLMKRKRAKSTNSILSFGSSSSLTSSNYHTLVRGNYEFPFNAVLPGSLTESIEGLPNAAVTYTIEAIIERPKLADLICRRHLRVIRTLRPDALELTETISVDNTWPEKVDYSISIPAKAVPIGSSTSIDIVISPLLKGLRLGPVKIHLVENTQLCSSFGITDLGDRLVSKVKIKDPFGHLAKLRRRKHAPVTLTDGEQDFDSDELEFQDNWTINTAIDIPSNLLKCAQDCAVLNSIKVRHKLKFVICLINPDGHVSELRASLPIMLFISPFVPVKTKTPEAIERDIKQFGSYPNLLINKPSINIGSSSGNTSPILLQDASLALDDDNIINENEDILFTRSRSAVELCSMANTNTEFNQSVNGLMVPPDYGSHVYDRVWNGRMSPVEIATPTPVGLGINNVNSGTSTPIGLGSEINLEQLNADLQGLSMERASSADAQLNQTYFTEIERFPASPSLTPAYANISRDASFPNVASSSSLRNDFQNKDISRVPSYDKALKSEVLGDDLPPAYPEESQIDNTETLQLERPQFTHQKSNSSLTVPSRRYSNNNLSRSNNSSSSSLNILPSNGSGYIQSPNPSNYQKNSTVNKKFAFGMTPVDLTNEEQSSSVPMQRSSSKGNLSPSHKSGSFASLVEIFTKKK